MGIRLNIDASLLSFTENIIVDVRGNTIGECLEYFVLHKPALKDIIFDGNNNLWLTNWIRLNGKFVYTNPLDKSINDGDEIEVIKFTGG